MGAGAFAADRRPAAGRDPRLDPDQRRRAEGTDRDPGHERAPEREPRAAQGARPVRQRAPVPALPGRAVASTKPSTSWSCGRTPRACTRARVRGGHRRGEGADRVRRGDHRRPDARGHRRLDQVDLERGSERIVRFAFEEARRRGRTKVTASHKANIMKFTRRPVPGGRSAGGGGVSRTSPSTIASSTRSACSWSRRPERFDVLVLPNLYGDIVSELGAGPDRRPRRRARRALRARPSRCSRRPTAPRRVWRDEPREPGRA